MTYNQQQVKTAYKKLPPEIQELINSSDTMELIFTSLEKAGITNEEQVDSADSEILYAMYCLQTLDEAISHIASLSGKQESALRELKSTLNERVLGEYEINIDDFITSNQAAQPVSPSVPEMAPQNLPVVEPAFAQGSVMVKNGEVAHDVPHVETPMPEAKPIVPAKVQVATPDFRYQAGKDPYREPLQ